MTTTSVCVWGWPLDGVILGAGELPCLNPITSASPYGGLCDEHAMEMRLRLLLLPWQMIGGTDE